MALPNFRVIKDELTTQDRARAAIEAYAAKSDKRVRPGTIPVCKGQYLDVDGILARSLPNVVSQRFTRTHFSLRV